MIFRYGCYPMKPVLVTGFFLETSKVTTTYCVATTERVLRFYVFPRVYDGTFRLVERLDTHEVSMFGNKESARMAATAAGLKTWAYVRL
ncbi:hypothetical protein BTO02_16365 [Paraburkholderia sp. SOS3]|nr:hypothetical protein BTO02_16365 [Paraburkholderia sp. SOS3]